MGWADVIEAADVSGWLYVGGIDRYLEAEDVEEALLSMVPACRCSVTTFAEVPPFKERRPRDQGKSTHGWALLQFADEEASAQAAHLLDGRRLGGSRLSVGPARSRPQLTAREAAKAAALKAVEAVAAAAHAAHKKGQRLRRRERVTERVARLTDALQVVDFARLDAHTFATPCDWAAVPACVRPDALLGDSERLGPAPKQASQAAREARVERKRAQVESFAACLRRLGAERGLHVVDFGCGSGALTLPLAALFPSCTFVGVDMLSHSIQLLHQRAATAGLTNVSGVVSMIERYQPEFDVALALHACGNATDFAIASALRCGAAFLVAPCCTGKLAFSIRGGSSFSAFARDLPSLQEAGGWQLPALAHPRSRWLGAALAEVPDAEALLHELVSTADVSHGVADADSAARAGYDEACRGPVARRAKLAVELDRAEGAREQGYCVAPLKLLRPELAAKNDLLLGCPAGGAWAGVVAELGGR